MSTIKLKKNLISLKTIIGPW